MNEILVRFLGSLLKAIAISAIIAGVAYMAHVPVLMAFTVSLISQYIVSYLYSSYLEFKVAKALKEERLKELEILSRITFNVQCAACKHSNEVVINANKDTNFECTQCKAENSVYINIEAALVTKPLNTDFNPLTNGN